MPVEALRELLAEEEGRSTPSAVHGCSSCSSFCGREPSAAPSAFVLSAAR